MTKPSPEKLEREKDKLYVNDAELIRRLGVPERTMRALLPARQRFLIQSRRQAVRSARPLPVTCLRSHP
jgi:hypothetical protein